jgi:uncharacterized linocin/CFP29 family protein
MNKPIGQAQVGSIDAATFRKAFRPLEDGSTIVNKRTGVVQFHRGGGVYNSALRKDEWQMLDDIVVEAAGPSTAVLATIPKLPHDNIGVLEGQYNTVSQLTEADVSMSGRVRGQMDAVDYNLVSVPLPVVFKEVEMGERELLASRRLGQGLGTTQVFEAARVVAERLAGMLYNGYPALSFNGSTIYGLTTHPNRNTGTGGDWGTIANIQTDVVSMIAASKADNYHGPWTLDVATTQYTQMLLRYADGSSDNALTSVLQIPGLEAVVDAPFLTAGTAVLRQNGRNVVEWQQVNMGGQEVNGIQMAVLEWMSGDGFVNHLKVVAVASPIIKSDYEDQSGIVVFTGL